MKILFLSDQECPALWDHYRPERVEGIDLIVSCGDLKRQYLEFLVTMVNKPVLYVPGNHDTRYLVEPPEGCDILFSGRFPRPDRPAERRKTDGRTRGKPPLRIIKMGGDASKMKAMRSLAAFLQMIVDSCSRFW